MALSRSRRREGADYWPGFVDALSTLVIGINFATEGVADLLGLEAARGATGQ